MVAYTLGASSDLVFYFNMQVMVKCCNRAWKKSLLLLLFSEYSKNCSNYFEKKKKKNPQNHGVYEKALSRAQKTRVPTWQIFVIGTVVWVVYLYNYLSLVAFAFSVGKNGPSHRDHNYLCTCQKSTDLSILVEALKRNAQIILLLSR